MSEKKYKEKSQIERFKETARKIEVDESDDALDKAFGKVGLKHIPQEAKKTRDK